MRDASICGLGQTASSAIESAIERLGLFGVRRERRPRSAAAHGRVRGRRRSPCRSSRARRSSTPAASSVSTTPTLCYGETLRPRTSAASAWSRSRARACWRRPARARPRPGMKVRTDSERVRHSRRLVLEFLASSRRPLDDARGARLPRGVRRAARALRPAGAARPGARPQAHRPPRRARRPDGGHRVRADQDRQRAVRARLLEVHPLLQVRRRLRRPAPEHVRDHGRGPGIRRAHLDRVRRRPARVGLRLLRQLHRRLPDRRADVHSRARPARGRGVGRGRPDPDRRRSARTAASAATSSCTCRTTRS